MNDRYQEKRSILRQKLLSERLIFEASSDFATAQQQLQQHLLSTLQILEPEVLGIYTPIQGEFNLLSLVKVWQGPLQWALPFAHKTPPSMHYRLWQQTLPSNCVDEFGLMSGQGPTIVPDVIVVPCLGFTSQGFRLGYGAGYFDRWLSAHPHVTTVGVAWSLAHLSEVDLDPQPHDQALMVVVTEQGVGG